MQNTVFYVLAFNREGLKGRKADDSIRRYNSLDDAKWAAEQEPANRHIVIHEVEIDADEIIVKDRGVRAEIDFVGPRRSGPPF
jgi:hypothetical protein